MKTKPVILLAAISALIVTGASAQQETPPPPAATNPPASATPAPDRPRDGDAPRAPGGPRGEGFRPEGGRGERFGGGPRRDGGPRDGAANVETPRDGAAPGGPGRDGGPRDGANPGPREGGPRAQRDGAAPGGPRDGAAPNSGPSVGGPSFGGRGGVAPGGPGGPREGRFSGGPQGDRSPGRDGRPDGAPEVRKEKRAFLGVMAAPMPPVLSAQLAMAEGFGLVVQAIAPESPAAKAGLQKYDVLKLLNDQQIVDQAQLATLVSALGNGKEVTLTVLRKAQEQKIAVTLGEHEVPVGGPEHRGFGPMGGFGSSPGLEDRMHNNPERAKEMQDKMREFQHRMQEGRGPGGPREGFGKPGAAIDPERLLQEARPGGGAEIRVETQAGSTTIDGTQAHLKLKDASGEIEVATEDGKRILTARDPEGKVVFTGPVNTEEERAAVPEPIRKKLAEIHVRQNGNATAANVEVTTTVERDDAKKPLNEADFQ